MGTLVVFSVWNTGEQTIWSYQSRAQRYDISNKASDWSAVLTTSETLEFANGITFENWSKRFLISSNIEHRNYMTPRKLYKINFIIWVNWSKFIVCQTGLPKNMNKMQIYNKGNWPTLRGSKPSQTDSRRLETWNIGSLICILNILKVENHET